MRTTWTKHLKDEKQRKNFENLVRNSTDIRNRLAQIIKEKQRIANHSDFTNPAWAYEQAKDLGYNMALKELLDLVELKGE